MSRHAVIGNRPVACPAGLADAARAAHDLAVARLTAIGVKLRGHAVKSVEYQRGEVKRPKGWAIRDQNSQTGYTGAYSTGTRIVVITAPDGSAANVSALPHEWAESLLTRAKVWDQAERHRLIAMAKL